MVAKGWGIEEEQGNCNRYEVSFEGDKNRLKLIVVMIAQLCKYAKKYQIVHTK